MAERYTLREAIKLLGVDQKTVQSWLDEAGINPQRDAGDKRRKLLSHTQLEMLAARHGRTLLPDPPAKAADLLTELERKLRRYIDQRFEALRQEVLAQRLNELANQPTVPAPVTRSEAPHLALPTQARAPVASTAPTFRKGPGRRQRPTLAWSFVALHGVQEDAYQTWLDIPPGQRESLVYAQQKGQALTSCGNRACPCHDLLGR